MRCVTKCLVGAVQSGPREGSPRPGCTHCGPHLLQRVTPAPGHYGRSRLKTARPADGFPTPRAAHRILRRPLPALAALPASNTARCPYPGRLPANWPESGGPRWCPARTATEPAAAPVPARSRSEEHTSELQSLRHLVCRLLIEKNTIKTQLYTRQTY